MATGRKIRVFIASPDDVDGERKIAQEVVERVNREISDAFEVVLECVTWKTHSTPGMGRAQSLVNPLVDTCDVFIGVLWCKFGSPPGRTKEGEEYSSGTEEEFRRALSRWEKDGAQPYSLPRIMLYFSEKRPILSKIDPAQLKAVEAFKKEFGPSGRHPGLYHTFKSQKDFERMLHQHVVRVMLDLARVRSHAEVISDFVSIPPDEWNDLFNESKFGNFLIMYSYSWRNTYLQQLRGILKRGGELQFLFPSLSEENKALPLMANRIGATVEELRGRIREARDAIINLGPAKVRFTKTYLNHSLYLFERGGVVGLYSYKPDRSPSPAIRIALGPLYNQCMAEFNYLYDVGSENEFE